MKKAYLKDFFRQAVLFCLFFLVFIIFLESCVYIEGEKNFLPAHKISALVCVVSCSVFFAAALMLIYRYVEKINNKRRFIYFIWSYIIVLQTCFLIFFINGGFKGVTDTCRIVDEAIAMLESQNGIINNDGVYFGRYGNNYPFTIMVYFIFKIVRFVGLSSSKYYYVLMVLNVIFINISSVFAFKLINMLRGNIWGIKYLLLFALSPTTYVWIGFAYTNTFSMPFIMGVLYYGIKAIHFMKYRIQNIMIAVAIGAVGYQIRATTIIPIIAVIIGLFLMQQVKFRQKLFLFLMVAIIFGMITISSSLFCNAHIKNTGTDTNFPFTHWIMMGLNKKENGFVNSSDVNFSMSLPTRYEKIKGNLEEIRSRLSDMGIVGWTKLALKKLEMVWGMGTDGNPGFYANGENIPLVHKYLYGDKRGLFLILCQAFRCITFLLVSISVFFSFLEKKTTDFWYISLTSIGAILFFLLWETNKKYNICFMNLFYLLMSDGITILSGKISDTHVRQVIKCKKRLGSAMSLLFLIIPIVITIFTVFNRNYFLYSDVENRNITIQDVSYKEEYIRLKNRGTVMWQTFEAKQPFNEVRIMYRSNKIIKENSYVMELLDAQDNVIAKRNLPAIKKAKSGWLELNIDNTIEPALYGEDYKVKLLCIENQNSGIEVAITPFDFHDLYRNGHFMIDSERQKRDMVFCVSEKYMGSRMGKGGYIVVISATWLFSGLILYKLKRWVGGGMYNE